MIQTDNSFIATIKINLLIHCKLKNIFKISSIALYFYLENNIFMKSLQA